MRKLRRAPRTYVLFVLLAMFGPLLLMLLQGDAIHPSAAGLAFVALLLVGLGRGSSLAWALLLAGSLLYALAVAATLPGGPIGGWLSALLLCLVCAGLLLSSSMRRHVGIRGLP